MVMGFVHNWYHCSSGDRPESFLVEDITKSSRKAALLESGLWITIALIFNAWFAFEYGAELGIEFLTGYLVEKSLSVDNLFVILLIFGSFKVPAQYQHRILFYGVLGAIVLTRTLYHCGCTTAASLPLDLVHLRADFGDHGDQISAGDG